MFVTVILSASDTDEPLHEVWKYFTSKNCNKDQDICTDKATAFGYSLQLCTKVSFYNAS